MLEQSSIISICSAIGSAGIVIYATVAVNKENIKNVKESLMEFKSDIKEEIAKEKKHAMELASQRIGSIEKDVDEMWPRLRRAEDNVQKNCLVVTQIQKDCDRRHREGA